MIDLPGTVDKVQWFALQLQRKISLALVQLIAVVYYIIRIASSMDFTGKTALSWPDESVLISNLILVVALDVVATGLWFWFRRLPRFRPGQIGLLFAIQTDNDKLRLRIKDDFIQSVQKLLRSVSTSVRVESLSEYHTEKMLANQRLVASYHSRTQASLIVYGVARTRKDDSAEHYFIEVDESVVHKPIVPLAQMSLVAQMKAAFPKIARLSVENEYKAFRVHSVLFTFAAKYTVGLACLYSQDPDTAYLFHKSILDQPTGIKFDNETITKVHETLLHNVSFFVFKELEFFARRAYIDDHDIDGFKRWFREAASMSYKEYEFLLLEAIYDFFEGDNDHALNVLERAKQKCGGDYTWAYSRAFILAFVGKLQEAYDCYRAAFSHRTAPSAHIQSEMFIRRVLETDPAKYQLHYCLGLIYLNVHEDLGLARDSLSTFVRSCEQFGTYAQHVQFARNYIEKIEQQLSREEA